MCYELKDIEQVLSDVLNLWCKTHRVIGLRLSMMTTGGVSAVPEALRLVPEKIAALADAQVLIATSIRSGRPASAPAKVIALFRERVSANNQRLNITTKTTLGMRATLLAGW
jgi:hypothetical protein